jgi:hypothetical protein
VIKIYSAYWLNLNCGVRISMAIGSINSAVQYEDNKIAAYHFTLDRIRTIPFGITFFRTSKFITFEVMFTIGTFTASVFGLLARWKDL